MVSLDSEEKNREFAASLDANFPLLSDPGGDVAKAYGVLGMTRLFAKRWTFYIDSGGVIRHVEKNVDTTKHGEQMARTLEDLGFPRIGGATTPGDEATPSP